MNEDYAPSDAQTMMHAHDALESGVYLVEVWHGNKILLHAVFSTVAKAQEWMDTLLDEYQCLCAPFVVDMPDYGNVPKKEQN